MEKILVTLLVFLLVSIAVLCEEQDLQKYTSNAKEDSYEILLEKLSNLDYKIENYPIIDLIEKGEFEKTSEFEERVKTTQKEYEIKKETDINDYKNKINKILEGVYKCKTHIEAIYNADKEEYNFTITDIAKTGTLNCSYKREINLAKKNKLNFTAEIIYKIDKNYNPIELMLLVEEKKNKINLTYEVNSVERDKKYILVKNGKFTNEISSLSLDIQNSFYISKYEITQEEYETIMGYNPSRFKGKKLPVENVTWFDAIKFCNDLSIKENLPPYYKMTNIKKVYKNSINDAEVIILGGNGFRLPTESEWEFASRGGNISNKYSFSGDNIADEVAWYNKNSGDSIIDLSSYYLENDETFQKIEKNNCRTHTVGTKKQNELGIFDMNGNVSEWTETESSNSDRVQLREAFFRYYSSNKNRELHDLVEKIKMKSRIIRGGNWKSYDNECEVDSWEEFPEENYTDYVGFRIVRNTYIEK